MMLDASAKKRSRNANFPPFFRTLDGVEKIENPFFPDSTLFLFIRVVSTQKPASVPKSANRMENPIEMKMGSSY